MLDLGSAGAENHKRQLPRPLGFLKAVSNLSSSCNGDLFSWNGGGMALYPPLSCSVWACHGQMYVSPPNSYTEVFTCNVVVFEGGLLESDWV